MMLGKDNADKAMLDGSVAVEWQAASEWHDMPRDGTLVEGDLIQLWLEMSFSTLSVATIESALAMAIPVWFDARLMALLTDVDMSEAEYNITELSARSIIVPAEQGGYIFPQIVRQRLLRIWEMPGRQAHYVSLVETLAEHYLILAEEQKVRLKGAQQTQALEHLDRFYPNVQAVWEAARALGHNALLYRLASTLDDYHTRRALWSEKVLWLKTALSACATVGQEAERAEVANSLGIAYMNLETGDMDVNLRQALHYYDQALTYFTPQRTPLDYAMVQNNIGNAYLRCGGARMQNLRKAVVAYEAALQYCSLEASSLAYGTIHSNLAFAYAELSGGRTIDTMLRAVDSYQAALQVYTAPSDTGSVSEMYARLQVGLGTAYAELSVRTHLADGRGENLYAMIRSYQEALRFYTIESAPTIFSEIHIDVAHAYMLLCEEGHSAHLWDALNHYELALLGVDRERYPHRYAETKVTLGLLYTQLAVDMDDQHTMAFAAPAAKAQQFPEKLHVAKSVLQHNIDNFLSIFPPQGSIAYLQQAVTSYEDALSVYSLEASPLEYAKIQVYMGLAYAQLSKGERATDLHYALEAYQTVNSNWGNEHFSSTNSSLNVYLGCMYEQLATLDASDSLMRAIACYEASLAVYSPEVSPQAYERVQQSLHKLYSQLQSSVGEC